MDSKKGYEPLNQAEFLIDKQPERSSPEDEGSENENDVDQILKDRRERRRAWNRQYWTLKTDEQRDKLNARARNRRATDVEREKLNAGNRKRWAMATDEKREKRNARNRELYANATAEQAEKRKADGRKRQAMYIHKKQEKKNASSGGKNSGLIDEQEEKQKDDVLDSCAKATVKEHEADQVEEGDINNASYLGSRCIKSPEVVDEQFETTSSARVEQCTSKIGPLDYFEVCEDWRTRIKMEDNGEE